MFSLRSALPFTLFFAGAVGTLHADPFVRVITGEQMRIGATSVVQNGSRWSLSAVMQDDNENPGLGTGFRRWWHFEIAGLNAETGETIDVTISNSGYTDRITPVISFDDGQTYERLPISGPFVSGGVIQTFTITTPPGRESVRLSKYFPFTLPMLEDLRSRMAGQPKVTEEVIGASVQGRPIYMFTLTDPAIPDDAKRRVWIHAAVHPSETTASFVAEGLMDWLVSGSPEANEALRQMIITVVPMANPDGVAVGNYRTNVNSVNLENEWRAPYNSTVPEIVALRTKIEEFQGTAEAPGANPIEVLLNLHSSHGSGYPFHFIHQGTWFSNGTGVTPEVRALEIKWVNALKQRDFFSSLQTSDPSSSLSGRPFVESMMHDRYTLEPQWPPVMAITHEGTYQLGPIDDVPSTDDDYRIMGANMGPALADFFDMDLGSLPDLWVLY